MNCKVIQGRCGLHAPQPNDLCNTATERKPHEIL